MSVQSIRPEVPLPTSEFLNEAKAKVPDGAPAIVIWINDDGSSQFISNNTLRRDWAWMAAWLTSCAVNPAESKP